MSGRIRTIKPELLEDERTAALSHEAWRLFVSMFLLADDYGNLRANTKLLDGQVFWAVDVASVSRMIRELVANELVALYECRGQRYAHLTGWKKHQRVDKPGAPRCPGPNDVESSAIISSNLSESRESFANDSGSGSETVAPDPDHDPDHDQRPMDRQVSGADAPSSAVADVKTSARRVFEDWKNDTGHHRARLDRKREARIRARFKDGFTADDLIAAIANRRLDPFLMGKNKDGKVYDAISTLLRDREQVERLLALGETGLVKPAQQVIIDDGKGADALDRALGANS